jgi:hypothetical protein
MSRLKRSAIDKDHATIIARQIIRAFGPAPVLSTESEEGFRQLVAELVAAIKPGDVVMRLLVFDIAVFTWEMTRLRRYKTLHVERELLKAAIDVAGEFLDSVDPKSAMELLKEGSELRHKLAEALDAHHLTTEVVDAQAYHRATEPLESLDAQLMTVQARRTSTFRELEAYRERVVRKADANVIDIPAEELELAPTLAAPRKGPVG